MKREFSLKQIMQMILVCLLLVAVVYIFYRADHAELSQLNGSVTASQGTAPLENESDPALRSFTYLLDKGESTEYYLNYEDNPVMRYIANYKTFEASDGTQATGVDELPGAARRQGGRQPEPAGFHPILPGCDEHDLLRRLPDGIV